jgi:hypothetical protein
MEKINHVQGVAVSKTTQAKNVGRLRKFLVFCEGLGIQDKDVLLAKEDLLVAWAFFFRVLGRTNSWCKKSGHKEGTQEARVGLARRRMAASDSERSKGAQACIILL